MSISAKGIVHGLTSSIFDCMDCGVRYESKNALGLAAKHWHKTGHHIIGEVAFGWSFPTKVVGLAYSQKGDLRNMEERCSVNPAG